MQESELTFAKIETNSFANLEEKKLFLSLSIAAIKQNSGLNVK